MKLQENKYIQIIAAYIIASFSGVMAKMAALNVHSPLFFLFVGMQMLVLGTYAVMWQQILKKFRLGVAVAFRGLALVLSLVWATLFFRESVTPFNMLGSLVIIVGIYIVSTERVEDET